MNASCKIYVLVVCNSLAQWVKRSIAESKVISPPFGVKVGWVALSYNRCTCIPKAHSTFCPFSFCFVLFSSAFRPLFFVFGHFVFFKESLLRISVVGLVVVVV